MTNFERFREVVFEDTSLRDALAAETEVDGFVRLLVDLAAHRGFAMTEEEVRAEVNRARRSWIERQVP